MMAKLPDTFKAEPCERHPKYLGAYKNGPEPEKHMCPICKSESEREVLIREAFDFLKQTVAPSIESGECHGCGASLDYPLHNGHCDISIAQALVERWAKLENPVDES